MEYLNNSNQQPLPDHVNKFVLPDTASSAVTGLFEDLLNSGVSLQVRVTGRSMTPFIRNGEIVTINKVRPLSLQRGDLIFFRNSQGFPVLHRLIRKKYIDDTLMFQTKGDALLSFDEPVMSHHVLGKVGRIEKMNSCRKLRYTLNMESPCWRTMNHLIAIFHLLKSTLHEYVRQGY